MIDISKTKVEGFEAAIRGMRNPLNSWDKSDSYSNNPLDCGYFDHEYVVGEADDTLAKRLILSGSDHSKFMRMIQVSCDISAPLYWWKEYDTYKIGTVADSCSTMHTIHKTGITPELFSTDRLDAESKAVLSYLCDYLERRRVEYNETEDVTNWEQIIQLLPTGFNQLRTVTLNYAVLRNQYFARRNHKLQEWREFCQWIETLPHSDWITISKPSEKSEYEKALDELSDGIISINDVRKRFGLELI